MKFEKVSKSEWSNSVKLNTQYLDAYDNIKIPVRKTVGSAGYDFVAPYDFSIEPGNTRTIGTGIKVDLDRDKVLMIAPRSSIGIKHGISMTNTQGYIDSDYYNNPDNEGHIFIDLKNNSNKIFECKAGDRFAQGIIIKYFTTDDDIVSEKRIGGIGSTGA